MMKDGDTVLVLEILASDGRPRLVSLLPTDKYFDPFPVPHEEARNPKWHMTDPTTHDHNDYETISYLTEDRTAWDVSTKCYFHDTNTSPVEYISTEFTHTRNGQSHTDDGIIFLDWNGVAWRALAIRVNRDEWPTSPKFLLKKR